ncbi:MAG TPA: lipoprotein [Steroidobacteraceae bacterium]|nr:lipoprotein [Steroidobacteraceae bacterium]
MKFVQLLALIFLAGEALGCGQKGPLVMPDAQKHKRIVPTLPGAPAKPANGSTASPAPAPVAPAPPAPAPAPDSPTPPADPTHS